MPPTSHVHTLRAPALCPSAYPPPVAASLNRFVLITGYFPFGSTTDAVSSSASFEGDGWRTVSLRARDFIRDLLQHDPTARPSSEESLGRPWLHQLSQLETPESPRPPTPGTNMPDGPHHHCANNSAAMRLQPAGAASATLAPTTSRRSDVTTPTGGEPSCDSCSADVPPPPPGLTGLTPVKRKSHATTSFAAPAAAKTVSTADASSNMLLRPAKKRLRHNPSTTSSLSSGSEPPSPQAVSPRGPQPSLFVPTTPTTAEVLAAAPNEGNASCKTRTCTTGAS